MGEQAATSTGVVMDTAFWIATVVFLLAYALIIWDKIHKTIIALAGAALILLIKIVDQTEAFHSTDLGIDWNVIFLLFSMMLFVNIMRPTGVFEYVAIKSAKLGKGRPFRIMAIFAVVTAIFSASLDNVTTVLLIAPVTLLIADALDVDPIPYLIVEALASNIGGTATLIGDPPNIMIGSRAQLSFVDFVLNLGPIVVILMIAFLITIRFVFGRRLKTRPELQERVMEMDERAAIKDWPLLRKALIVLVLVIVGFVLHGTLGYEPATVALAGASFLLLISGMKEPHHVLSEVEWSTLFFFIGLFILVGAIVKVGLIEWLAMKMLAITGGNMVATSQLIGWFSAFASAFVDNIPYTATMIPLIQDMGSQLFPGLEGLDLLHHPEILPLWWALALGACLGGNGTAIGASANVIVVGMSERAGKRISFIRFTAYGMPIMVLTMIISMLYVYLRYYAFG